MVLLALNPLDLLIQGSLLILLLSLWAAVAILWRQRQQNRQQQIQNRLNSLAVGLPKERILRLWHDGQESTTVVPYISPTRHHLARLEELFRSGGIETPLPKVLCILSLSAVVSAFMVLSFTGSFVGALGVALAFFVIPWIYLQQRIARRQSLFESQLSDALELAARSLRAGHPLTGSFRLISEEIPPPIGTLFSEIIQQQSLGLGFDEALHKTAASSDSSDLKLFATSVIIQMRTGGNLADMMERLALVIRDRIRLTHRVRVLTAQTQLSKRALLALPLSVFVILNLINPNYMGTLYHSAQGRVLLIISVGLLLFGWWLMNRLAAIHY